MRYLQRLRGLRRSNRLFRGDGKIFKSLARKSRVYGEYGMGKSTEWVGKNTDADIIAVDTSSVWVDATRKKLSRHMSEGRRIHLDHVDLGETGPWGRPLVVDAEKTCHYAERIYRDKPLPDLVLNDGRFRVCCFLTSLKYCVEGTPILFDDYVDRPSYHAVEEFVKPRKIIGQQALFEVPPKASLDQILLDEKINEWRAFPG